jgi:hypothetical protein
LAYASELREDAEGADAQAAASTLAQPSAA